MLLGLRKEVSQTRLEQNLKREIFKQVLKRYGDCQRTLKIKEKIRIAVSLGIRVNTKRKGVSHGTIKS